LQTYFFLSITICEFTEFMSSQSNASGLNKSIERRTPSITEVLSHYQDITASSMMKHQKGTLLITSHVAWLNDLIGLELLSTNKAEVKSTSILQATIELVCVRVRLL